VTDLLAAIFVAFNYEKKICNKLLSGIVLMTCSLSMTHLLVFPFLVLTVANLLFYRLPHYVRSGPGVVMFL